MGHRFGYVWVWVGVCPPEFYFSDILSILQVMSPDLKLLQWLNGSLTQTWKLSRNALWSPTQGRHENSSYEPQQTWLVELPQEDNLHSTGSSKHYTCISLHYSTHSYIWNPTNGPPAFMNSNASPNGNCAWANTSKHLERPPARCMTRKFLVQL